MSIPPRFLDDLRARLTLSEIVGKRVKLARAGREYKACCPFHSEKSPSFYVNDEKQFYHCFGCGAHGDIVGFVMQHDNLSFVEAVDMLAAQAGMQVPRSTPQAVEQAKKEKGLHALLDDTAKFFSDCLRQSRNADAMGYLKDRGVPDDLIASFRLGYAPEDGGALVRHLKQNGYTLEQMIEAGVARRSERGGEPYGFFRDRVMFPVTDRRGRIVAFGGRVLPEHLRPPKPGAQKTGKYINSPDTPLFYKGTMLYGEAHARQAAADGQKVIVVEGYLDVMACFGAGYRGAVAPLGTALTEDQILSLWKMIPGEEKLPVLCFDGDAAGRRAAAKASAKLLPLLQPYHSASIAFLPEGQDPDSLIRSQGSKAFEAILSSALPLDEFLWQNHVGGRRFDTPESRAGLAEILKNEASQIPDRTVQQYYQQSFRDKMYRHFAPPRQGVTGRGVSAGAGISGKGRFVAQPVALPPRRPAFSRDRVACLGMMAAMLNHPHIYSTVECAFGRLDLGHARLDRLRQAVEEALQADQTLDGTALQAHLKERGFETELGQVLNESIYVHAGFARPQAPPEKVLSYWMDFAENLDLKSQDHDVHRAKRDLAQNMTQENEERLVALLKAGRAAPQE